MCTTKDKSPGGFKDESGATYLQDTGTNESKGMEMSRKSEGSSQKKKNLPKY